VPLANIAQLPDLLWKVCLSVRFAPGPLLR